jgi:HAD superfamily phosphoserine phosphatase-like hydrolase
LFVSDFDQTLTFNDSGYVLSEMVGIPTEEFERKAKGMAKLNLVQQGAELAYLLLHDPEFKTRVRKEHLYEVGKRIRLKENIELLYKILETGIEGYRFDFFVLSAAPVEIVKSALEGIVPADHIFGTQFRYTPSGQIESITRATAGYGKVAAVDELQSKEQIGPDHIVYVGDGSSDVHVMLHVNRLDGFCLSGCFSKPPDVVVQRRAGLDVPPRCGPAAPRLGGKIPVRGSVRGWRGRTSPAMGRLSRPESRLSSASFAANTTYWGLLKQPDKHELASFCRETSENKRVGWGLQAVSCCPLFHL